jgi:hypothetical protein
MLEISNNYIGLILSVSIAAYAFYKSKAYQDSIKH